ncbi:MAG: hypothetical protein O2923_02030 [Verrucomicrobia bacterium]|nr:hypothetical protein [Verrucomicrobiota bacterium]MDA1086842.1 hypothetical protein [Verrucomicrobiota bacterium]
MKDSYWTFNGSPTVIALALLAGALGVGLILISRKRHAASPTVKGLEWLRAVIMALILFTLLQPEFVRVMNVEERPRVVILHDASASMQTLDIDSASADPLSRETWVRQQLDAEPWAVLNESGQVVIHAFSTAPTNASADAGPNGTDINEALENTLRDVQGLRAVILMSDGDWNLGGSPLAAATKYRVQDTPVYTVTTGRDSYLPDLVLESVTAPTYGLLDEHIVIPFTVRSHLENDVRTTVQLIGPAGTEASKSIVIPAGRLHRDSLVLVPREEGEFTFEIGFPRHPDELSAANNARQFRMSLRREVLKVLVVDSLPRWEYRYLRNALVRDPGVDVSCLLLHPDMDPGWGPHYIRHFPSTVEELSPYDVIVLGDVGREGRGLSEKQIDMIRGLVEQQGSGLVLLPGPQGKQASLLSTPLADLYPVQLDTSRPRGQRVAFESKLHLTQLGKGHLLTLLHPDAETNGRIWEYLPGFYWSAPVVKSKPGSETLAVHHAMRNEWGRVPLLVIREFGNGKVLFLGTNGAWRWRRGFEDTYHYRFWSQVVRWMSHKRHLSQNQGIRLFHSPEAPRVGETMDLHATVFDRYGFPISENSLSASIVAPDQKEEFITLSSADKEWGTYHVAYAPAQAGTYELRMRHPESDERISKEIDVFRPTLERVGQPAQSAIMQEIARVTGAEHSGPRGFQSILDSIAALPQDKILENRVRLWSNPAWGALIMLLLCGYWIGRKIAGVI